MNPKKHPHIGGSATSTLGINWRHSGWEATRARIRAALIRVGAPESRLERFDACGREAFVCHEEGNPSNLIVRSNHCHDRWCQPCARGRAFHLRERIDQSVRWCGELKFITLTLRSTTEPLRDLLDHLYTSFARLRRTLLWKQKVRGGFGFLEVTRGKRGDRWHVHLHLLADASYVPQAALSAAWMTSSNGSWIVDIRDVSGPAGQSKAVQYVTKYAAKGLDSSKLRDEAHLDEALLALKGRRLVLSFGNMIGIDLTTRSDTRRWVSIASLEVVREGAKDGHPKYSRIWTILTDRLLRHPVETDRPVEPHPPWERDE